MRHAFGALALSVALGLLVAPAEAKPAKTLGMSAMRVSPGKSYPIVAVVPRGTVVNARYCISNGWCRVKWRGRLGWVDGKSLRTRHLTRKSELPGRTHHKKIPGMRRDRLTR